MYWDFLSPKTNDQQNISDYVPGRSPTSTSTPTGACGYDTLLDKCFTQKVDENARVCFRMVDFDQSIKKKNINTMAVKYEK